MTGIETTGRDRFWSAANEALDDGTDPLTIGLVQDWVAENPSDGDDLARLIRRVDTVARARRRAPQLRALIAAGTAIAGAVAAVLVIHFSTRSPGASVHEPRSCILQYSLEVVREVADSRTSVEAEPGWLTRSQASLIGATTIVSRLESRLP